jgi:hypothetical protein
MSPHANLEDCWYGVLVAEIPHTKMIVIFVLVLVRCVLLFPLLR